MPYTLAMFLLWAVVFFAIGLGVGWMLRSVSATSTSSESTRDRGSSSAGADQEAMLGAPVRPDDLTAVDGISPLVAELCAGLGITTWRRLADTDVDVLQSMLDVAGPRFVGHDPSTWPHQARLLADGEWESLRRFQAQQRDA